MEPDVVYSHPSYGTIRFSRFQGGSNFFCVEPTLDGGVSIEIHTAKVDRHLSRDWVHNEKLVVRARMSSYQFAEAITNLNRGEGVPITLEYANNSRVEPYEAMPHERKKFEAEVSQATTNAVEALNGLRDELNELQGKGKAGKKDLENLACRLNRIEKVLTDSMPFIEKSFQEILDKQTHKAKVEFSAWIDDQVRKHGLESLTNQKQIEAGES